MCIRDRAEEYEEAFREYEKLDLNDFDNWKYYYFYLWYINVEYYPLDLNGFIQKHKLDDKLKELVELGFKRFGEVAEFQYLAGYTINLFPYYYGDYEEWEQRGNELLKSAHKLEPDNLIYNISYQGSPYGSTRAYNLAKQNAIEVGKGTFAGIGILNRYFKDVLLVK